MSPLSFKQCTLQNTCVLIDTITTITSSLDIHQRLLFWPRDWRGHTKIDFLDEINPIGGFARIGHRRKEPKSRWESLRESPRMKIHPNGQKISSKEDFLLGNLTGNQTWNGQKVTMSLIPLSANLEKKISFLENHFCQSCHWQSWKWQKLPWAIFTLTIIDYNWQLY